jgi:hypothetical protein
MGRSTINKRLVNIDSLLMRNFAAQTDKNLC